MEKPLQKDPFLPLLTDASPANYYSSNNSKASSGSSLKTRILSLTDTGLRLLNTGRVSEGLGCYTSMFNLLKNLDDSDGSEFQKSFEQSIEELNKIAMRFVQHGDTESGHQVLTFCEETTQPAKYGDFPLPRTTTFNNLACLYRRIGKPKGALNYLRTALTLLNKKNLLHHSATTYLNLSAVHSQLGDHHQALTNAKNALLYAQEELLLYKDDIDTNQEKYKEKVIMLSIAYHNIGSEEEHLKNFNNSLNWYQKAYSVMDEYGIVDEKLYNKFKTGHQTAQDVLPLMIPIMNLFL